MANTYDITVKLTELASKYLVKLTLLVGLLLSMLACSQAPTQQPLSTQRLVAESIIDGQLASDSTLAVTLGRSRTLSLWALPSHKLMHQWNDQDFSTPLYLTALSGNNRLLLTAGKQQLTLFDVNSGDLLLTWQAQGFDSSATISCIALNQTGSIVLIGMNEGSVIVVNRNSQTLSMFKLHDAEVNHLEFTAQSDQVLSAGNDGHAVLWHTLDGQVIRDFPLPQRITSISFDAANRRLFIADALDNNQVIDPQTQQQVSSLTYQERYRYFRQALFVDQGKGLITATSKQAVTHWDVNTGEALNHWNITAYNLGSTVMAMTQVSSDELITLSSDGTVERWAL
ncbi:WD40 repeat domain-containing protein [Shewanella colwelliana]|uniref:WD40 repeat domain-containing protein n=1 Tax=Shewanella colwelliana TaxID=23 RepID=UPI003735FFF6